MIDTKVLPELKKHVATLTNQLSLFETKVKDAPDIEPRENGPEEERERILSLVASYQKKLPEMERAAQMMRDHCIHHLEVTEHGQMLGVLSITDYHKYLVKKHPR
jgi:hypothetical protein